MDAFVLRFANLGQWWNDRTNVQKISIVSAIAAVVAIIVISVAVTSVSTSEDDLVQARPLTTWPKPDRCYADVCVNESKRIEDLLNFTHITDRCWYFDKFVCREMPWEKPINMQGLSKELLLAAYKEPIIDGEHEIVKAAKALFQKCISDPMIDERDVDTIREALKAAGGYPALVGKLWNETDFNWMQAAITLRRLGYDYTAYLAITVSNDPDDERKKILQVSLPNFPDTSYARNHLSARRMLYKYAEKLGAHKNRSEHYVRNVQMNLTEAFDFQEELVETSYTVDNPSQTVKKPFHKYTVAAYQELCCASINWLQFINGIVGPTVEIKSSDSVLFPPWEITMKRLNKVSYKSKRNQADLMMWRVIIERIPFSYFLRSISYETITVLEDKREDLCLKLVKDRFVPDPVKIMLARKYVPDDNKELIEKVLVNMTMELVELVKKSDWLEGEEKAKVITAFQNLTLVIGHPGNYSKNKILNYIRVDLMPLPEDAIFLQRLAQADRNYLSLLFEQVKEPQQIETALAWDSYSTLTDLDFPSYHAQFNTLAIPTAFLKNLVISPSLPLYSSYGTIGSLIGFYLFDILTVRENGYDVFNNEVKDWQNRTQELFKLNISCSNQAFYFLNHTISGGPLMAQLNITQQISYTAYNKWAKDSDNKHKLDSLSGFTPKQCFWISTAITFCNPIVFYGYDDVFSSWEFLRFALDNSIQRHHNFARDFACPRNTTDKPVLESDCPIF